jgi:putative transposase
VSPSRKRAAVEELRREFSASERRACRAIGQPRSSYRYEAKPRSDVPGLLNRLLQLVRRRPRFGYRRIAALLRGEGYAASESRVLRLWRREGLKVPQKKRKKRRLGVAENGCDRLQATHKNHVWAWDFAFDRTESGTQLKWLSIVDEHTRECLALKVARSITSEDLIDTVAELLAMRGVPENLRSDNGSEFVAKKLQEWLAKVGVTTRYVEPASPWQNGYAESFHSRLRDEFLAVEAFDNLAAARKLTAAWREDYNHYRPHGSLGYVTPVEYAARCPASAPELLSATPQATPPLQQGSGFTQTVPS